MTDGERVVSRIMTIKDERIRNVLFDAVWAFVFGTDQERSELYAAAQAGGLEAVVAVLSSRKQ